MPLPKAQMRARHSCTLTFITHKKSLVMWLSFFAAVLLSVVGLSLGVSEDVVQTRYGPVRGLVFNGFRQFQGVMKTEFLTYLPGSICHPTLGKPSIQGKILCNRLTQQYPIPPGLWTDVKDCRNFTIGCAQTAHSLDVPKNTSEVISSSSLNSYVRIVCIWRSSHPE
jgi:hypothetical protein